MTAEETPARRAVPEIESIGPKDAGRAAKLIAAAFHDDPIMTWAFNGTAAIEAAQRQLAKSIYLPQGFCHQTTDDTAGTLWLPPNATPSMGFMAQLNLLFSIWRHGGGEALSRAKSLGEAMASAHPRVPHYYLYTIAVHPDHQGKGLGRAMLSHAFETIDAEGAAAYLENTKPANTPLYRSFGFEVTEEFHPAPDCPPMLLMWRPGRSSPSS